MSNLIGRLIDIDDERNCYIGMDGEYEQWNIALDVLAEAQPDTDCALKEFGNCSYSETGCSDCKVKMKIRNALSAQPEIVRCRDCKECWYSGTATIMKKVCEIYKCKFWDDRIVSQNGYCYMAERRIDDE